MNIEEKAKRYDEALERAEGVIEQNPLMEYLKKGIEYIFPELKESEDERIRKEIIAFLKENFETGRAEETWSLSGLERWIAWLKKQDPKKHEEELEKAYKCADEVQYRKGYEDAKRELKKQGEQKPADKVEPKFRNGQWVVWQGKCYKVNYNGCGYELVAQNGLSTSLEYGTIDENAHLWGITKDAKAGDVLSDGTTIFIFKDLLSDGSVMSYCDYDTDSGESDAFCPLSVNLMCSKITPATKEQRDLLFQKMHETGYMWDSESKQLLSLKVEPSDEQKPTWSEEDEKIALSIEQVMNCASLLNIVPEKVDKIRTWLKSIKERL